MSFAIDYVQRSSWMSSLTQVRVTSLAQEDTISWSTRIKDAGIAIRHSRGRILFYTAGSRNGLGSKDAHLKKKLNFQAVIKSAWKFSFQNKKKSSKTSKTVPNFSKNYKRLHNSANTHPNHSFVTGNWTSRPGDGLGTGPGAPKRRKNQKMIALAPFQVPGLVTLVWLMKKKQLSSNIHVAALWRKTWKTVLRSTMLLE